MFPVIIQIGPIIVYSLWLFAGLAFLLGVFVFSTLSKQKRLNMNFIYNHSFAIFIFGLIGARLVFVFRNFPIYFPDASVASFISALSIWDKGLSLVGGLLGITLSIIYFSYREREQTLKWLDTLSISVISGLALGHIGTFLDGSSYGRETNLPWGIMFDNPSIKYAVPIHPVQLYAFLYSVIIAVVLYILYRKSIVKAGMVAIIGLLGYFTMVFLESFIRGDDVLIIFGLREEQWFSLIILIITGGYLLYRYNRNRKKKISDPNGHA